MDALAALWNGHQWCRSHLLMRVWNGWEKANMNTCHFGGEIKADSSTDIAWDGGTSYQDNSIGKMHKVQERRCATPYSFENRDWLPFVIDSHAWEIAKAKGAESEAKEVLKAEHTAEKKEKPSSCVGRKTKAYRKGWLGSVPLQWKQFRIYLVYEHHQYGIQCYYFHKYKQVPQVSILILIQPRLFLWLCLT